MFQLRVQINAQAAEHLEDLLFSCGAVSISYEDAADEPILEPGIGDHPLWSNLFIQAHFTDQEAIQIAIKAMENDSTVGTQIVFDQISEQDWQENFQQQFIPMQFGPLWIYPSWEDNPDPTGLCLQLDPGLAFGTGHHATTSLCLKWLGNASLNKLTVTDFGCGSGILALAAARLGADHVYAVDIDPQALLATEDNILRNQLPIKNFTIGHIDCLKNESVDLVIANILAAPLIELRDTFAKNLKHKGRLVVSGILESQVDLINDHYSPVFLCENITVQEEWACISYTRTAR